MAYLDCFLTNESSCHAAVLQEINNELELFIMATYVLLRH